MIKFKNPFKITFINISSYFSVENKIKRMFSDKKYKGISIEIVKRTASIEYVIAIDPKVYDYKLASKMFDVDYSVIKDENQYINASWRFGLYLKLYFNSKARPCLKTYKIHYYESLDTIKEELDRVISEYGKPKTISNKIKLGE